MNTSKPETLVPEEDYTINSMGDLVFTAQYHLKRGFCCQSACLNCPYGFTKNIDPNIPSEFKDIWEEDSHFESDLDDDHSDD